MGAGDRCVYRPEADEDGIVWYEVMGGKCGTIRHIGARYAVIDFDSGEKLYVKREWLKPEEKGAKNGEESTGSDCNEA